MSEERAMRRGGEIAGYRRDAESQAPYLYPDYESTRLREPDRPRW